MGDYVRLQELGSELGSRRSGEGGRQPVYIRENIIVGEKKMTVPVYQGQFGPFTIDDGDRRGVLLYRTGLVGAAAFFALGSGLILHLGPTPLVLTALTILYWLFLGSLGLSLWTIHIYLRPLHRLLQSFWGLGALASAILTLTAPTPWLVYSYQQPWGLVGVGFGFAALTGIFFKEAFCFNRLETKFLTPLVPSLLLGHLAGFLSYGSEKIMLALWSVLFIVFALRKAWQPIPPDIGDKSVFTYLQNH